MDIQNTSLKKQEQYKDHIYNTFACIFIDIINAINMYNIDIYFPYVFSCSQTKVALASFL